MVYCYLQANNCDYQIPAKAYEYIRAQKPVLALTSITGDTGKLLLAAGISCITPLNDKDKIKLALIGYLEKIEEGSFDYLKEEDILKFSRQYHATAFEKILLSAVE